MPSREVRKKIGILGGSFDPVHMGHLNIAQSAYLEYGLDEVWFIPAGHSPNKDEREMTPVGIRAEMVSLAIEAYPHFRLSRIEMDTKEKSYTYLTLTKLKAQHPDSEFYFIMGADSLDYFEDWKHPEIICEKAVVLAAGRDDMDIVRMEEKIAYIRTLFPARIYPLTCGHLDVSSTELRWQIKHGTEEPGMLPKPVLAYIKEHQLYGYQGCDGKNHADAAYVCGSEKKNGTERNP